MAEEEKILPYNLFSSLFFLLLTFFSSFSFFCWQLLFFLLFVGSHNGTRQKGEIENQKDENYLIFSSLFLLLLATPFLSSFCGRPQCHWHNWEDTQPASAHKRMLFSLNNSLSELQNINSLQKLYLSGLVWDWSEDRFWHQLLKFTFKLHLI